MAIGAAPADIEGLIVAGDAGDLLLTDGAPVTSWGWTWDAPPSGASSPTFVADAWRGHPAVQFGTGRLLRKTTGLPAALASGLAGCTLVAVVLQRSSVSRADVLTVTTPTMSSARHSLRLLTAGSGHVSAVGRRADGDSSVQVTGGGGLGFARTCTFMPHVVSARIDHVAGRVYFQQDGVPVNEGSFGTTGSASATVPAAVALGASPTDWTTATLDGYVFAWAIYDRCLTPGEVGRLAQRWWVDLDLVPPAPPRAVLPWDLDVAGLEASERKAIGHRFLFPVSRDNADPYTSPYDVWDREYVSPNGQSAAYANVGGLWRDRPVKRSPRPESCWWLLDELELVGKMAPYMAGWATDLLTITGEVGRHWTFAQVFAQAAALRGRLNFACIDASALKNSFTTDQLAYLVETIDGYGAGWHLDDGRTVVQVYSPENLALPGETPTGSASSPVSTDSAMVRAMDALDAELRDRGIVPAWQWMTIAGPTNYADALDHLTWCESWWGTASKATSGGMVGQANAAHGRGHLHMMPLHVQDWRPKSNEAQEAEALQTVIMQIQAAITGQSEFVYIVTIADYSEASQWEPHHRMPLGWLAPVSWWLTQWQTGRTPTIVRDGVLIVHRTMLAGTAPTDTRDTTRVARKAGSAPFVDIIEVHSWLPAAAELQITTGAGTTIVAAPAGYSSRQVPLALGRPSVRVVRGGREALNVLSDHTVTATPTVEDYQYLGTLGVGDPYVPPRDADTDARLVRVVGGRERPVRAELVLPGGDRSRLSLTVLT